MAAMAIPVVEVADLESTTASSPTDSLLAEAGFQRAMQEAFDSAATKFDSLSTYFSDGLKVEAVAEMFAQEMREDLDFAPFIKLPSQDAQMLKFVRQNVGKGYGLWKKCGGGGGSTKSRDPPDPSKGQSCVLGWASTDNYPAWVCDQIRSYVNAEGALGASARRELEQTLLETPLYSATIKYDGTCFGKLDSGMYSGRRLLVGKKVDSYLQASTAAASACDAEVVRAEISAILGVELAQDSTCVWGELMCNPGFYKYQERGLADQWLCFGVVVQLPEAQASDVVAWSEKLRQRGFAHSLAEGSRLRLLLCPALRQLLHQAGCSVAEEVLQGLQGTHAELVAHGAAGLSAGANEGIILVFPRHEAGQASVRKWKNAAEGGEHTGKKHAQQLRGLNVRALAESGLLHPRIAEMVETLIAVAETDTAVSKIGRKTLVKA